MFNLNKQSQKGFTLIEVLAVLVISSIVMIVVGNIVVNGYKSYDRTVSEDALRDEADLIMAKLNRAVFPLFNSDINNLEICAPNTATCDTKMLLNLKDGTSIGFDGEKIITPTDEHLIEAKNIELTKFEICYREADVERCNVSTSSIYPTYIFKITLLNTKKNKETKFETEIPIIYSTQ